LHTSVYHQAPAPPTRLDAQIPRNRLPSSQMLRATITAPHAEAATVVALRLTCVPMTSCRDVSQTSGMIANGSWIDRATWLTMRIVKASTPAAMTMIAGTTVIAGCRGSPR
jgi:hypothetical protein